MEDLTKQSHQLTSTHNKGTRQHASHSLWHKVDGITIIHREVDDFNGSTANEMREKDE
jgi:hypothetical protein